MFSSDQLNTLIQDALSHIGNQKADSKKTNEINKGGNGFSLTPQQALVIAGILAGVLELNSLLVDRNQNVEIVLVGTLKRRTQFDNLLQQLGSLPFTEVVKGLMERMV